MRVIAEEKFRFFYNHVPIELAKGEQVDSDIAVFLLQRQAPVVPDDVDAEEYAASLQSADEPEQQKEPEAPPEELDIDGTAAGVLAWVGDDPDRAAEALASEQAKDKPRSTLVKQLEKLAAADPGE